MFEEFRAGTTRKTVANLADTIYANMINYALMLDGDEPPYDALPGTGEEVWHQIFEGNRPVGHCYHRSLALVHALSELGIDGLTMLTFATARYLSMGKTPERVAGGYANHFITCVEDNGSIIWADSGRPLEEVDAALRLGEVEFPGESLKKVAADPSRARLYVWRNPLNGKTIYCGEDAIRFALRQI